MKHNKVNREKNKTVQIIQTNITSLQWQMCDAIYIDVDGVWHLGALLANLLGKKLLIRLSVLHLGMLYWLQQRGQSVFGGMVSLTMLLA